MSVPSGVPGMGAPPRPGSAAGRAPGGLGLGGRPMTGLGGAPPLTSAHGAATGGSAYRPSTGLPGADAARPMTMASGGPGGGRLGTAAAGRQVRDKSYHLNEIRKKNRAVQLEIERLDAEAHERRLGTSQFDAIERKYDSLRADVAALQGRLADQNVVLDVCMNAVDGDAQIEQLRAQRAALAARNAEERRALDDAFERRVTLESGLKEAEAQLERLQLDMRRRVDELPSAKRREYESLEAENERLAAKEKSVEADIERATAELQTTERALGGDQVKQRALALRDKLRDLTETRSRLREEKEATSLPPETQRERLKEKIRTHKEETARAEAEIVELQRAIHAGESKLAGARNDLTERDGGASVDAMDRADKLEKLLKQERELTEYIENFEPSRARALNDADAKRVAIVAAMERTARHLSLKGNLPNQTRFKELEQELAYKQTQVANAEHTNERLAGERAQRQQELDKIDELEDKIAAELEGLRGKMKSMEDESRRFGDLTRLASEADETKARLERELTSFRGRKDALRSIVNKRSLAHERRRRETQGTDAYKSLERMEVKIRTAEAGIHTSREYINAKEAETDYGALTRNLDEVWETLNAELQKRAMYT